MHVIITNLGSEPVKVGGIFGYIPIIGNNNQDSLQPLIGIIAGGGNLIHRRNNNSDSWCNNSTIG